MKSKLKSQIELIENLLSKKSENFMREFNKFYYDSIANYINNGIPNNYIKLSYNNTCGDNYVVFNSLWIKSIEDFYIKWNQFNKLKVFI